MAIDGWKISVNEARAVITSAETQISDLRDTSTTKANNRFSAAATACESLDIGDALDTVLKDLLAPVLTGLPDAGDWVVGQTRKAINAYVAGDETMADDAQQATQQAPKGGAQKP